MESRRTTLLSCFFLFALLLSAPLAVLGSPLVPQRPSSLSRRIAEVLYIDAATIERRDVVRPKITSPNASSVWPIGSTQTVTWDTSDFPPYNQITNKVGRVILGRDSGDSLNLDIDHPLAQGFNITDGKVSVVVPDVPPRDDYLIVLMGDSGNTSPSFAITAISAGPGSSSSSSPSSTPAVVTPSTTPAATLTSSTPATPPILSSTTITDPIPITGSTITGGATGAPGTFPTFSETVTSPSTTTTGAAQPQEVLGNSAGGRRGCWVSAFVAVIAGVMVL